MSASHVAILKLLAMIWTPSLVLTIDLLFLFTCFVIRLIEAYDCHIFLMTCSFYVTCLFTYLSYIFKFFFAAVCLMHLFYYFSFLYLWVIITLSFNISLELKKMQSALRERRAISWLGSAGSTDAARFVCCLNLLCLFVI